MSGWIILVVSLLCVLTLRAMAAKYLPRPQKPYWINLILIVLFVAGGLLTLNSMVNLGRAIHRKDWPVAKGRVMKSEAILVGVIRPMIIYTYEADGRTYVDTTDLQIPGFGNKSKQLEVAQALVQEFPSGREIQVHYDPADYSNSVILTTPPWHIYGKIGLGVTLFTVALFFLVLPRPGTKVRSI